MSGSGAAGFAGWRASALAATLLLPLAATGQQQSEPQPGKPQQQAVGDIQARADGELHALFQRGVAMLHAKRYEFAFSAFHEVLSMAPRMPEAHVNMGFVLVGLERYPEAADFFYQATELRPAQANAYYGLALALEAQQDLESALGAMRTYIHLTTPEDPYLPRARAALWEWQQQLSAESRDAGDDQAVPAEPQE
jgi:tetratricopeptide (TPR) repeat protein